jgi:hypothetical protein
MIEVKRCHMHKGSPSFYPSSHSQSAARREDMLKKEEVKREWQTDPA